MHEGTVAVEGLESFESKILANFPSTWGALKTDLTDFMKTHGEQMLHSQPDTGDPNSGKAWQSPRTWWLAGRSIATLRALGMDAELEEIFAEACVGKGAATEFMTHLAESNLPKPEEFLKDGMDYGEMDKVFAVILGTRSYVRNINDKNKQYDAAALMWKRLNEMFDAGISDMAVDACDELTDLGLGRKRTPDHLKKAAEPVIFRMGKSGMAKYAQDRD
jgi:hypothetical protein